ncbi:integrin alpha-E [Discoglossus pictus]
MKTDTNICRLLLLLTFSYSDCFNIDTEKSWSCTAGRASTFCQKVLQYKYGSESGVYVSSPLEDIERRLYGGMYKCRIIPDSDMLHCAEMDLFKERNQYGTAYPIMSMARNSDNILTCEQRKWRKPRSTTEELNGVCTLLVKGVRNQTYTDLAKDAIKSLVKKNQNNNNIYGLNEGGDVKAYIPDSSRNDKANRNNNNNNVEEDEDDADTEIAIVLDSSGSISDEDFQKAKDFISNMMKKFWEKCLTCEFAVVQYSHNIATEFDLQDSRDSSSSTLEKVQAIKHMRNVTRTASALQHVLDYIFNEDHGSKKMATKIILVLTDGDIFWDPLNLTDVIASPKMQNIERFAIGVGEAFNKTKALNELKLIASKGDEHLIKVDDYSALNGLLSSLQQKIIGIEGTKGDALGLDLAETGFAAHIKDKESLVFGAVGAYDWSGGLIVRNSQSDTAEFLNESTDNVKAENYGYLGYSVTTIQTPHSEFYIAGAPRHSNVGKVLIFEKDITSYHLNDLKGEQLGSYFGSEICSLDVKSDGKFIFLLVGAPFYHIKGEEGRVYIYKLDDEGIFTLVSKLEQHNYAYARFGYSIANIGDINQDGYQDIAIGAPLEGHFEEPHSFGSVYIYNSDINGPRTSPSQQIRATHFTPKLQYFGQSIDGGLDLTNDGYPDISVGSLNNMMVLRSRPVVKLKANVQFNPDKIPLAASNERFRAHLCFDIKPFNVNDFKKTSIHYSLELDIQKDDKRISFENDDSGKGKLYPIRENCTEKQFVVLACKYDCFSSILIKISYTLISNVMRDLPAPILDMYDTDFTYVELPYVKDCNNQTVCVPNLNLTTHLSQDRLVVGQTKDLVMKISLENTGGNSYITTMVITYPKNLQFRKTASFPTGIDCSDSTGPVHFNSTLTCKIVHPVFKATSATVSVIWHLDEVKFSSEQATIYVNVTNANEGSEPLRVERVLPVQHSFTAILTVPTPTIFVNISQGSIQNKDIQYIFNVNGENQFEAGLVLDLLIPISFQECNISEVKDIQKTQASTQCKEDILICSPWKEGTSNMWNCGNFLCRHIQCHIKAAREEVTVTATLFLSTIQKLVTDTQELLVTGEILYNHNLFVNLKDGDNVQISIILLKDKEINVLPVIIGSSIGGILLLLLIIVILCKCGFFKRKYKDLAEN